MNIEMKFVYNQPKIGKIKKTVDHQGIGGKKIVIEREDTITYALDYPLNQTSIALHNFLLRRLDIINEEHEDMKIYYGHVGNLGYFIAEDELDGKLEETTWQKAAKYLK